MDGWAGVLGLGGAEGGMTGADPAIGRLSEEEEDEEGVERGSLAGCNGDSCIERVGVAFREQRAREIENRLSALASYSFERKRKAESSPEPLRGWE